MFCSKISQIFGSEINFVSVRKFLKFFVVCCLLKGLHNIAINSYMILIVYTFEGRIKKARGRNYYIIIYIYMVDSVKFRS